MQKRGGESEALLCRVEACDVLGAEHGFLRREDDHAHTVHFDHFQAVGAGGHASAPAPHTPVGKLSMACAKVENHPFKMHITKPAQEMFDTLGRHSSFLYRMILANLWAFGWVLDLLTRKTGGELNALLRTTVVFTQMKGSKVSGLCPCFPHLLFFWDDRAGFTLSKLISRPVFLPSSLSVKAAA